MAQLSLVTRPVPIEALRAELQAHVRNSQLSFVVDRGQHFLIIPEHLPIAMEPARSRATGSIFHEETTTLALNYLLGILRPRRFFDVGASSGYFSRVAASYRSAPPRVDAFEMRPSEIEAMHRII